MLIDSYRRHLAASVLVLSELSRDRAVTGLDIRDRIHLHCRRASERDPAFDFVGWAGATFWEFLDVLARSQFLRTDGPRPRSSLDWANADILLAERGADFMDEVRPHVGDLVALFLAREVGPAARSVA